MIIPDWTTELSILWALIIILVILVVALSITIYIVYGNQSKTMALLLRYERSMNGYLDVATINLKRLGNVSREIESLVQDDQDLIQSIKSEIAGSTDPTVLAMGGPDRSPLVQD